MKKPKNKSLRVEKLKIPLADLKRISDHDRYSYYLLGHMFNELMCLQKLIFFTMPKHDDRRDIRMTPEISQAFFLFRTALSKIYEVMGELEKNSDLKSTFNQLIYPKWPEGKKRQEELKAVIANATWLSKLRNKLGFHFPNFSQLEPFIKPTDDWTDDFVFMSEQSENVFYDSANTVILHSLFNLYNDQKIEDAIDPMVVEMIGIIKHMSSYIKDAVGVLITESILRDHNARTPGGLVNAPVFENIQIPFWTHMPTNTA